MCIQVATLDNWSILARSLFKDDGTIDLDVAAFFLSFIVVVVFVLLPVVAAVYTDLSHTQILCIHASMQQLMNFAWFVVSLPLSFMMHANHDACKHCHGFERRC